MHPTFRTQADERVIRSEGFVRVDLLPRSDALALREEFLSRFPPPTPAISARGMPSIVPNTAGRRPSW